MLAQLLRPSLEEQDALLDYLGLVLIAHAASQGMVEAIKAPLILSPIRRAVGGAYDSWWLSLPWWRLVWLSGAIERRHRLFAEHARQCGLLDKWVKRSMIGIGPVGAPAGGAPRH